MTISSDWSKFLKSIELSGVADESAAPIKQLINRNLENVLDLSSGKARIRPSSANKFELIHFQPAALKVLSALEIRCLHCRQVISYPAWHLKLSFAVNVFHYFVCFSPTEASKAKLTCKG